MSSGPFYIVTTTTTVLNNFSYNSVFVFIDYIDHRYRRTSVFGFTSEGRVLVSGRYCIGTSANMELDLEHRDPNGLNSHVQVAWEDVFGEPDGIRSMDCVWRSSYSCFECCKGLCYKIMTFCCGICIAFGWGCEFAVLAFNHVWCWTPCIRDCSITYGCLQKCLGTCLNCCIVPFCEAFGSCLSKIKITKG